MNIGDQLKEARQRKGLTIAEAEMATKIRGKYLRALEEGAYEELPARVYSVGFLRTYARFLGINPEELVEEFKAISADPERPANLEPVVNKEPFGWRINSRQLRFGLIVGIAVILLGIPVYWLSRGHSSTKMPPASSQITSVNQPDPAAVQPIQEPSPAPPTNSVQPARPTQPVNGRITLELLAQENTWVQVAVDGVNTFTGKLTPGERKLFSGNERVWMLIGNAGGVELIKNGTSLGFPGKKGQVVQQEFRVDNN
ncbi:MAG: helix-turn-helix domain-containing protein [Firmicutes bacterium]|nr:helix-turn-helix domain-containing protein [Bacillota bacterium]